MKKIILYLIVLTLLIASVSALSKPIAGFVFLADNSTPVENVTVTVYVNTTFSSVNPCYIDPLVLTGPDGSYATNLDNLRRSDNNGDCSGLWSANDIIWAFGNGSTAPTQQGNGQLAYDQVENGTGLQYLENMTVAASSLPQVSLISPLNGTNSTNSSVILQYNVTDDFGIVNCSLFINGQLNQTDESVTQGIPQSFPLTLPNGAYDWNVTCYDDNGNPGYSETWVLYISVVGQLQAELIIPNVDTTVNQNQFFEFISQVTCLESACGDVNASLDPIMDVEESNDTVAEVIKGFFRDFFSMNILTGMVSGALVPTTPTTPWWTNSTNPADFNDFSCLANMQVGDSCNTTWFVNASGNATIVGEFFAYYNSTTDLSAETSHINITIGDEGPPLVFDLLPPPGSIYNSSTVIEIAANATDDTNISTVYANVSYPDGFSELIQLVNVNGTDKYNISFVVPVIGGTYSIKIIASDVYGKINDSEITNFVGVAPEFGELVQTADRLNYNSPSVNHTVLVENRGVEEVNATIPIAAGWTFTGGVNCTDKGVNISCIIPPGGFAEYVMLDPNGADPEYKITPFPIYSNNSYAGNTVRFIKILDRELFHTLVEYGRGRGNYFFDSAFNSAGSGHSGESCPYLPNNTLFELSYLHKVLNVGHYFGSLTDDAYNASFSCTYPNRSVIRQHLITDIVTNTSGAFADYRIGTISPDTERTAYLSMDFLKEDQYLGENITINCTEITYAFPLAGGNMTLPEDSFTFEIRDRDPFVANATTTAIIGNGSQEVEITYTITNIEQYKATDVVFEINAPQYSEFIGVRGELWGTARDIFRLEGIDVLPGETRTITLVARFNTSEADSLSSLNLTEGINVRYTTCWELNAYNPTEYIGAIPPTGAVSVNMGITTEIISVPRLVEEIYNLVYQINETVTEINETVNDILIVVDVINTTTQDTNILVKEINITSGEVLNITNYIVTNTYTILNDTTFIYDQLNCNGSNDSPLCTKVNTINNTVIDLLNYTLELNHTAHTMNYTVINIFNLSEINITPIVDLTNLTYILKETKNLINCTNYTVDSACERLDRIENYTNLINESVHEIYNYTDYFNESVFGNVTLEDIQNSIENTTVDTSEVLAKLRELREFDDELVFLVTDSIGSQQKASKAFLEGDVETAAKDLDEANAQLVEASELLVERSEEAKSGSLRWIMLMLIMVVVALILAWFKHHKDDPPENKHPDTGLTQKLTSHNEDTFIS